MPVGSMALVHYAMPRATVDIDVVVNILPENVDEFIAEFATDYYIPINRAKDSVQRRRMFRAFREKLG